MNALKRVMVRYPDKTATYFYFGEDGLGPYMLLGGQRYTVQDIIDTGATAIVNNAELLRKLSSYGMPCRPTPKQNNLSISVGADTQERLRFAAKSSGQTISSIIESLVVKWLDENNF